MSAVGRVLLATLTACGSASVQVTANTTVVTASELDEVPASRPEPQPATPVTEPTPGVTPTEPATPEQPIVFGLLDGDVAVEAAWDRWRANKATTFDAAFEIAVLANRGRPVMMADELMVIALAKAVELSVCDPDRLGKVRLLAIAVRGSDHPRELDAELTRLADMGPTECAQP